jgi:hypothetical protein
MLSALYIYMCCKVLYFILSEDDFEIKSKIYSLNLRLVLNHILNYQDVLSFRNLFLLYFFKLSAGHGFWTNLRSTDSDLYKLCIRYQRSLRRFEKAQLDLKFLLDCKKNQVYPKFVRWKNITHMKRKKAQTHYLHLLLNDAIHDKKITLQKLTTETTELTHQLSQRTTWMKYKLICFSINHLLSFEKTKIVRRHQKTSLS